MLSVVRTNNERKSACHYSYDNKEKKYGDHINQALKMSSSLCDLKVNGQCDGQLGINLHLLVCSLGEIVNCEFGYGSASSCVISRQLSYPGQCKHYRPIEDPRSVTEDIISW